MLWLRKSAWLERVIIVVVVYHREEEEGRPGDDQHTVPAATARITRFCIVVDCIQGRKDFFGKGNFFGLDPPTPINGGGGRYLYGGLFTFFRACNYPFNEKKVLLSLLSFFYILRVLALNKRFDFSNITPVLPSLYNKQATCKNIFLDFWEPKNTI